MDRRPPARLLEPDRRAREKLVVGEVARDGRRLAERVQRLLRVARPVTRVAEAQEDVRAFGGLLETELQRGAKPVGSPRRRRGR